MGIEKLLKTDLREKLESLGLERFLDLLGAERLYQKKARMANLLKIAEPDEALYREIMFALGYKNNKLQFLELALILPYSEIRKLYHSNKIEKALLYRAGFSTTKEGLPPDFDLSLQMDRSVWQFRGTRPANFPQRRIMGVSKFLSRSSESGLCKMMENTIAGNFSSVVDRRIAQRLMKELTNLFTETKALGKMRALEIDFNIVLPFFLVYFEQKGKERYPEFLQSVYQYHPPLSDNSVTKAIKSQIFAENSKRAKQVVNSVRRYMGLIQLHNIILEGSREHS